MNERTREIYYRRVKEIRRKMDDIWYDFGREDFKPENHEEGMLEDVMVKVVEDLNRIEDALEN